MIRPPFFIDGSELHATFTVRMDHISVTHIDTDMSDIFAGIQKHGKYG